jgi:uncharacterized delta-60 repeat protein
MIRPNRWFVRFVCALALVLATGLPANAASGDPDTTFSSDGMARVDLKGGFDIANDVLVQPNGRILAVGQATGTTFASADFGLARFLSNGDPDSGFSGDGKQITDFVGNGDVANAVTLQGDGKIVAAGTSSDNDSESMSRMAVARYGPGGGLDTTFSVDGRTRTAFPGSDGAFANDVAVQSDGKIVVVGGVHFGPPHRGEPGAQSDIGVVRYKAGGAIDGTFGGGDGRVATDFAGSSDNGKAVALLDSGAILVAGQSQTPTLEQRIVLVKYQPNGSLDPGFSGDGKLVINLVPGQSEDAVGIAVRGDGKIVVGAQARYAVSASSVEDIAVALVNANGTLSTSFGGGDGIAFVDYGGSDQPQAMVRDSSGKLVFAGLRPFVDAGHPQALLAYRLTAAGGKDLTFGSSGRATFEDPTGIGGFAVALDGSHRPVIGGRVNSGNLGDFAVVRFQA